MFSEKERLVKNTLAVSCVKIQVGTLPPCSLCCWRPW